MIHEVEQPTFLDLFPPSRQRMDSDLLRGIALVGSGKGAIALVLNFLHKQGIFKSRLDEILVPDWLGYWVYNQIQPYAFPAKRFSERTKAILVYHQYGFPQNMDVITAFAKEKDLIIIEDCAHALASEYKGRAVGTFGDFAIYSFSKWVFCFALGGARGSDEFRAFAGWAAEHTPFGLTWFKDFAKWVYENNRNSQFANRLIQMSYALYGNALKPGDRASRLLRSKIEKEIDLRGRRYRRFREATEGSGICDHLERDRVTPYVIPIRVATERQAPLIAALAKAGVESGIYQFDVRRNLLEPEFVSIVRIPCHGGISDSVFENIINVVKKVHD